MCVTRPIHTRGMTDSYVWHDPFMRVAWLLYMCDMTHSCMWHDPSMCETHTNTHVTQDLRGITGWRRPMWCLNSQVIFCKRATNYRALLRRMTYKDKAAYGSSPPGTWVCFISFTCVCVTRIVCVCDMNNDSFHSYVWHYSFTWLIDMTHSCAWQDLCGITVITQIMLTPLILCDMTIYVCDMPHLYVWHDPSMYVTWIIRVCYKIRVMSHT